MKAIAELRKLNFLNVISGINLLSRDYTKDNEGNSSECYFFILIEQKSNQNLLKKQIFNFLTTEESLK